MIPCRLPRFLAVLVLVCAVPAAAAGGVNSWTSNGPAAPLVRALVVDPATPATLYAGTAGGGVHASPDGGQGWAAANDDDLDGLDVVALAIDPATPATLYAGTATAGVFRSLDGAATWAPASAGLTTLAVAALAVDPVTPSRLYAGTDGGGLFVSSDGGASWTASNVGLTATTVHAVTLDPTAPAVVYAGTDAGVFKSLDGGATWVGAGIASSVFSVAVDPTAPSTLYAGTLFLGVFKSTDAAGSWAASNQGLTASTVRSLAVDPALPTTVYAGTTDGGVFTSTDGGASWAPINTGLTHGNVPVVRVDPVTTTLLHAGTLGGGVFHYELDRCSVNGAPLDCGVCQTCDPAFGCIGEPWEGCRAPALPGKARLRFKNDAIGGRDRIVWTWGRGSATALAAFGDPTATTGYDVCIFDESGVVPAAEMRARIPAAGTCKRGKPCWKPFKQRGFKYRNGEALPDGLTKLILKEGLDEKAKIILKGRGVPLELPAVPMSLPIRLQLRNDVGECWEARYTEEGTVKNEDRRFNGKSAP